MIHRSHQVTVSVRFEQVLVTLWSLFYLSCCFRRLFCTISDVCPHSGLLKDDFITCEVNECLVFLGRSSHPGLFQPSCYWPLAIRSSASLTHLNLVLKGLIVNVFESSGGFRACAGVSGRRNRGSVSTWYECVFVLRCWNMLEWKTWAAQEKKKNNKKLKKQHNWFSQCFLCLRF